MDRAVTRQEVIDECCALIKAADDAAADNDYMLDSDDCIKVLRGDWGGPLANDMPAAPRAPQPPSASGEREAFVAWLAGTYPEIHSIDDAQRWWSQEHISALAWEARAALAPSPGIDAAEQKPVYTIEVRGYSHEWKPTAQAFKLPDGTYNLYAAPPAAQPSADNAQFPFYELRFIMRVLSHQGSAPKEDWQTAYGMARDIFVRWSKERQAAEPHPPSRACMCDACKPSFENGADDPAQRHDIVRQVPGPSSEWVAEAERLADKYASANAYAEVEGATNFRLPIKNARAALLAHLRTKPSTEPWCDTMDRPKSKCGCPDCGSSLIDLGPGLRTTPGKP